MNERKKETLKRLAGRKEGRKEGRKGREGGSTNDQGEPTVSYKQTG
jgi:hypothetical protein